MWARTSAALIRELELFEAAPAQGDGYTPATAAHYRRELRRFARVWMDQGLDSAEGTR